MTFRISIVRGTDGITVDIPDAHAKREFGGVPIEMIGRINLGPFAPSVPATMPDAKPVEKERGRKRGRDLEHEPVDALI
jgi:hypothetical protein